MRINQPLALLLGASLAAACGGDDEPATPDAVVAPDADTSPDAAVAGAVTLELDVDAGQIPVGTRIVFLDADDSVVSDVPAAPGTYSADLLAGGSVLVILPVALDAAVTAGAPTGTTLFAYLGVKPGDSLVLRGGDEGAAPVNQRTITAPDVGAATYNFQTPCTSGSSNTPSIVLDLARCGATTDVFVSAAGVAPPAAMGPGGPPLVKSVMKRGVSTAADIDLSAETPADPTAFTLDVTGIRPSTAYAYAYAYTMGDAMDWVLQPGAFEEGLAPFAGGTFEAVGLLPTVADGRLSTNVAVRRADGNTIDYGRAGAPAATASLDLGTLPLPWIEAVVPDVKASELRIITTGEGTYELAAGELQVVRFGLSPAVVAGPPDSIALWQFVTRLGGDQTVRLPTLPAAYADANLTADLSATGYVEGEVDTYASTGSLDDAFGTWLSDGGDRAQGPDLVGASSGSFGNAI